MTKEEMLFSSVEAIKSQYKQGNPVTVTITGKQETWRGGLRDRTFHITFRRDDARKFLEQPTFEAIAEQHGLYSHFFDGTFDGDCLDVETVSVELKEAEW